MVQLSVVEAFEKTKSSRVGLTTAEASARLASSKPKSRNSNEDSIWTLLLRQFRSPLVAMLLVAVTISLFLGDYMDAVIVGIVVLMSTLLGFWQELRAANALAALLAVVQAKATVLRDGREVDVPFDQVVVGDIVVLNAGGTIPGDGLLVEAKDLFVDESALTGESYPAEKMAEAQTNNPPATGKRNEVFAGTHVVSGSAKALLLHIGADTQFGSISERLRLRPPMTDFERGQRQFGEMLVRVALVLVIVIFAINVFFHRPVLESIMFSLAIAVGITPELLPAIVSITLSRGAQQMAADQVIVRRLASIENLGSMDVLCSDKTGTLTEGNVRLHAALDSQGNTCETVRTYAVLNATFESGFTNPIDQALRAESNVTLDGFTKFDEVPYDFIRKRLSVVVSHHDSRHLMITKGAFKNVLEVCEQVSTPSGNVVLDEHRETLQDTFTRFSNEGYRVLGVASRDVTGDPIINRDDEQGMTFVGFLLFHDPPKADAAAAVTELRQLGIQFKVITGDNRLVAQHLGTQLGIANPVILTGEMMHEINDPALMNRVSEVDIFAETEPNQKERIITALRKGGHVVGYLGDGINDASALHVADVGISVEGAVDVAKEAADLVLLRHDLNVLARGVRNGRRTFANTLKYIFITTSANFGNMFSMAGASFFLPFLPLLPKQILLNNFLSDLPALTIATDSVDPEQISKPHRWDQRMIQKFMIVFGLVSSIFDFLTFGLLLLVLRASESEFQTGWFIESLMTELFIVMVVRTRRPFIRSQPGQLLFSVTLIVAGAAVLFPYTPFATYFGLVPLPAIFMFSLVGISLLYLLGSELAKQMLFASLEKNNRQDT
jgi:P-type Mg2+ transporter